MPRKHRKLKKRARSLMAVPVIALLGIGGGLGYLSYSRYQLAQDMAASLEKETAALTLQVDEKLLEVEYGTNLNRLSPVTENTGRLSYYGIVNTMEPGTYDITYRLSSVDEYGQRVWKDFPFRFTVADTKSPEITFEEEAIELTEGDEFDILSNLSSVKDPVQGSLSQSDELTDSSYIVTSDLDTSVPGEYTVTVRARDNHGNESESSYYISVAEKPKPVVPEAPNVAADPAYPYYIRINRALNTVTVYTQGEDGSYSEPYTAFVCSTGAATPLGTYRTFNKSYWRLLYGPCYGQYVTDIVGDILFHSVPYFTQDKGDLEYDEYNKLGTAASMGCIRLCVRDAMWIFNNCPIGTTVELYDDWESPGPLGKPGSIYIDPSSPNRGWDPTDPDPENPW